MALERVSPAAAQEAYHTRWRTDQLISSPAGGSATRSSGAGICKQPGRPSIRQRWIIPTSGDVWNKLAQKLHENGQAGKHGWPQSAPFR